MTKQELTTEAQRIAAAYDGTITFIQADAEYFEIEHTIRALVSGIPAEARVVTHFEWNEFRFEGF